MSGASMFPLDPIPFLHLTVSETFTSDRGRREESPVLPVSAPLLP